MGGWGEGRGGWGGREEESTFPTILGYVNLGGYFLGCVIFDRYFLGVRFQNKAFCYVFLMYSIIKCSIFTIYASNLLELIKLLYKFNNLVAYFCHFFFGGGGGAGIATLTGILGVFWGVNNQGRSEPM